MRGMRSVPVPEIQTGQVRGPADGRLGALLLRGFRSGRAEGRPELEAQPQAHRVHSGGVLHDFSHHNMERRCPHMASSHHRRISAQWNGAETAEVIEPYRTKLKRASVD